MVKGEEVRSIKAEGVMAKKQKKRLPPRETAIQIVQRWRRLCAPDLDDGAAAILAGYIAGAIIDERARCGAGVRAALSKGDDRDFEWGRKLLKEVGFPKLGE